MRNIARRLGLVLAVSLLGAAPSLGATGVWKPANNGGKCLDATSNTTVKLNPCTSGNAYQQWEGILVTSNVYRQRNVARGVCLASNGSGAILVGCNTSSFTQQWYVETGALGGSWKRLKNRGYTPYQCLDAGQSDLFWTCNTGVFQQWRR